MSPQRMSNPKRSESSLNVDFFPYGGTTSIRSMTLTRMTKADLNQRGRNYVFMKWKNILYW